MNKKVIKYIKIQCVFMLLLSCTLTVSCSSKQTVDKPNFIVIYTDDQQYDGAGFTGNEIIHTPTIDKLAEQGMRFTNANVAFALCSPSRAAMLTGRYGSSNGVMQLNSKLNAGEVSVASILKEQGYSTAITGKWHIKQAPVDLGFDFYSYMYSNGTYYNRQFFEEGDTLKPAIHCDMYAVNRAKAYLSEQAKKDEPFFLYFCPQTPHMNGKLVWDAKNETKSQYNYKDMPVPANHLDDLKGKPEYLKKVRNRRQAKKYGYPDSTAIQKHALDYYSVITEMDGFIGKLLDEVKELGLDENTYVIFMSDNGWMVGDHGFTSKVLPYRPASHVPFFVLGPGIEEATVSDALVSNIDIAPTLLELAGIAIPENMHGRSIVPLINQESQAIRDVFVYEGLGKYGGTKLNLTAITDQYRLIITYKDETLSEELFRELYHQKNDEWEVNNLVDDVVFEYMEAELYDAILNHKQEILK